MCSIGVVHRNMGENGKALEYYNKSLEIKIKVHGQDHLVVADTKVLHLNKKLMLGVFNHGVQENMALVYEKLANPGAARRLEKDLLEIRTARLRASQDSTGPAQF